MIMWGRVRQCLGILFAAWFWTRMHLNLRSVTEEKHTISAV